MELFLIAVLALVASYVIQSFIAKGQKVKPASIDDWEFPQADEGTPQPVVFGDAWLSGPMVMWYGNYRTEKIKSKGKK